MCIVFLLTMSYSNLNCEKSSLDSSIERLLEQTEEFKHLQTLSLMSKRQKKAASLIVHLQSK